MITPLDIYLCQVINGFGCIFSIFIIILLVACFIIFIRFYLEDDDEDIQDKIKKQLKKYFYWLIFCMVIAVFLPSKQEIMEIYIIPKLANNHKLQDISVDGLNLINNEIKKYLKNFDQNKDSK